ncbi:MAG: hypothetical protein ACJAUP_003110 [Cellvibrionaceae bacterium]
MSHSNLPGSDPLKIQRLVNVGDITLFSDGSIEINPETGGINAGYGQGEVNLTIAGNITGVGPIPSGQDSNGILNADITGAGGELRAVGGTFGEFGRPLVVNFSGEGSIVALTSYSSSQFLIGPGDISTTGALVNPELLNLGGELLVEVETLDEIDPAIFTDIRNYLYDDVSIRLPSDQLYDDEKEEEKEY